MNDYRKECDVVMMSKKLYNFTIYKLNTNNYSKYIGLCIRIRGIKIYI